MLDGLPFDVFEQILGYLKNDGLSVGRISLCSSSLYDHICDENSEIWIDLVRWRWSKRRPDDAVQNYRSEYIRHHRIDETAIRILEVMSRDLRETMNLKEEEDMVGDELSHIGQAWRHPSWKSLLALRTDIVDILRQRANQRPQLFGFLAAMSLQNINFAECLYEYKEIKELELSNEMRDDPQHMNSIILERYALVICQIQQTPSQLLEKNTDVTLDIISQLDQIADQCCQQIHMQSAKTIMEKVKIVIDVLVNQRGFVGNEGDYYNYKNSLLLCTLESKKGIPITLCILYACVCQRLELPVHLVGLPGHCVLGLHDDDDNLIFLDVFRQGQLLSIQDCKSICASYGVAWSPYFLTPLLATNVFKRVLNNLANCHTQAMVAKPAFHSDLLFQQQVLLKIHGQAHGVAISLVERFVSTLSPRLSRDLLKYYGLLSRSIESEE